MAAPWLSHNERCRGLEDFAKLLLVGEDSVAQEVDEPFDVLAQFSAKSWGQAFESARGHRWRVAVIEALVIWITGRDRGMPLVAFVSTLEQILALPLEIRSIVFDRTTNTIFPLVVFNLAINRPVPMPKDQF